MQELALDSNTPLPSRSCRQTKATHRAATEKGRGTAALVNNSRSYDPGLQWLVLHPVDLNKINHDDKQQKSRVDRECCQFAELQLAPASCLSVTQLDGGSDLRSSSNV